MILSTIATPEKKIFEGELNTIILTTSDGEIAIRAGHVPLISTIDSGHIIIEKVDGEREIFSGFNGIINVENNRGRTNVKVLI
ncbi:MAG: synthase subunit epsilon, partial [Patescibacteria group bacterium]|nr:synthase subunit epsilon [Patescibacteria group bacterium]